jgi:5-methylthioadenosine/S-adenosylhomocysteine deaminase
MILSADWVLPVDAAPIRDGWVEIEGDRIVAVGSGERVGAEHHPGCVVLPGLVNAHTHLEYSGMSGFGDGEPFDAWIADHIRRRVGLEAGDYRAQADAGAAACLAGGVTTVADCCYAGTVAAAAEGAGLRAIVYVEAFSRHDPLDQSLEQRLDALTGSDLVTIGISPHAPYTVDMDDYRRWIALARERRMPVATHLLESHLETEPAAAFRDVLGADTVAVHVARATDDDVAVLAELDVPVAHCPRSNALLGCGAAPLSDLLLAGIRVGLGTDSPASALTLDMWDEMRAAILVARTRERRGDALTATTVLELATLRGAQALGLGKHVGSLTPGKRADLIVLELAGSPFVPWDDPVAATVFGGTPDRVLLTIVDGQIRYCEAGQPADMSPARAVRARMIET